MDRRTYLGGLATAGLAGVAGCLDSVEDAVPLLGEEPGSGNWGDGETVLDTPTVDRGDPSHPIYGQEMPEFTLPDPISGETVDSRELEGDQSYLLTFIFTQCPDGACPALLLRLRRAYEDARENGYEDDLALLAMTFDPERDTPDVLEEYAGNHGVDPHAANWHFLRPESYEEAEAVLYDDFGMRIERIDDPEEVEEHHAEHDHEDDHGDHGGEDDHDGHDEHGDGDDHDDYTFNHFNLILLVNEHGVVERSYPGGDTVDTTRVVEDVRAVTGN